MQILRTEGGGDYLHARFHHFKQGKETGKDYAE